MNRFGGVVMAGACTAAALAFGAGPATAAPAACTGGVQISSLAFNPPTVARGQSSTATAVVVNCGSQAVQGVATWVGRFTGSGTGLPAGCPVIDPLGQPVNLPAQGQASTSVGYLVFGGCQATALHVTVRITVGGSTVAEASTDLVITAGTPACSVTYTKQSEWNGGFVATVSVTNTSAAPVSGWTLTFTFPGDQLVSTAWNAAVTQSGSQVSAADAGYNAAIQPGGTVSFGFLGSWHGSDAAPTAFALNQGNCA